MQTAARARNRQVELGKIVRADSQVRYICQIYGQGETATIPEPADYAFGSFVRVPLRVAPSADAAGPAAASPWTPGSWAVGMVYDTVLLDPDFGTLGPRLSHGDQVTLFSPDYVNERAVLISILLLGTVYQAPSRAARVIHGVPEFSSDLGAVVHPLTDDELRAFHRFADDRPPGGSQPYLHLGYLPHLIAQNHPLLPMALLQTVERLERIFPENTSLLTIVKRNLAWRLKVQATQ
ncbi:MAG TPA: hypothetical protein VF807_14030 [Ktedonobacterales bacterium]